MDTNILNIISNISNISFEQLDQNRNAEKMWESFTNIEIIMALEEEYGITFNENEIANLNTVADIIEIVKQKVTNK